MNSLAGVLPKGGYYSLSRTDRELFRIRAKDFLAIPRVPTERQLLFILSTFTNRTMNTPVLLGGAMGGGKTGGLALLAFHLCRYIDNNRVLVCRKNYSSLATTTLQELEELVALCPDVKHWPGKHEIQFPNGSEIWYMGVGTPAQRQKLGSSQFGAVLIDEAPEVEHDVMHMLRTRLRWNPAARAKRLVLALTANPYPGWIKQDFITARKKGHTFIPATALDNPHLLAGHPEEYVAQMSEGLPEEWVRAFIGGDWNAMVPTTAIIPVRHVEAAQRRRQPKDISHITWGIDCGHLGPDKTVIACRYGTVFEIPDDYVWQQRRIDETSLEIRNKIITAQYRPHRIVVDYDGIGAGVADNLLSYQENGDMPVEIEIVGLHAQKTATIEEPFAFAKMRYANMKAQNAWELRKLLERGEGDFRALDEDTITELTSATYDIIDGRIYMQTKKLVKSTLGRSPDKGDAIFLTMYNPGGDEFAGLPPQPVEGDLVVMDGDDLESYARQQHLLQWYNAPFAALTGRGGHQDDTDLGY